MMALAVKGVKTFVAVFEVLEGDDPRVVILLPISPKCVKYEMQFNNENEKSITQMIKMRIQMVKLEYPPTIRHKIKEMEVLLASFLFPQASNCSMEVEFEERENGVMGVRKVGIGGSK